MSIHGGATRDFHVDKRHTALELIGGYDCYPDMPARRPDLTVQGGMRILKTACLEGDLTLIKGDATIEGNLTVLQTSYLANVFAEKITADAICVDDLSVGNLDAVCITTDKIVANTATFVDTTTANLNAMCITTDKISGNTATFVDITTANLTAMLVTTEELVAANADIQCLRVPQIKDVQKIAGPGDLIICNDGDLYLSPTRDVILSNVAMDFDLTKSILSNVRAVQAATGCPLELSTDPGFKIVVAGGDGIDLAGTDLCNGGDLQGQTANIAGKLTAGEVCTDTLTVTGNLSLTGDILADGITANTVTISGKLTVGGLIDPSGLLLDGQTIAPAAPTATQGLLWVDSSVMPAQLKFSEDGNTHTVSLAGMAFSGNLDMNGFEITNVSWVDGRDVSADGATLDAHVGDATIHFTEASIDHGNIAGLGDDDHTQYALLAGRAGGQSLFGGGAADETLVLTPNSADVATGNVIVAGTIDTTSATEGALVVDGGLGVAKNMIGGQALAGGFSNVLGDDAGITLPDDKHVVIILPGTATMAFTANVPAQTLEGQVLHVYNNSGFATTGDLVTSDGAGATLVSDGISWFQL